MEEEMEMKDEEDEEPAPVEAERPVPPSRGAADDHDEMETRALARPDEGLGRDRDRMMSFLSSLTPLSPGAADGHRSRSAARELTEGDPRHPERLR